MHFLGTDICEEIKQLIQSSIYVLKECRHNDEATTKKALDVGDQLIEVWMNSFPCLPSEFCRETVDELQKLILETNLEFYGFGNYSVIILELLSHCLPPSETIALLKCALLKPRLDNPSYWKLLTYIYKTLESKNVDLKVLITPLFLSAEPAVNLERLVNTQIHAQLARIFLIIFPSQNILHIQQFYPILLERLTEQVARLESLANCGSRDNDLSIRLTVQILNLLMSAIFPLCSLRNSFAILTLSPNLLELCLRQMPTTKPWFYKSFPVLHRNMLSIAFNFAKTYDFFVATSSLNRGNKFVGESPSSLFCQEQLYALTLLLEELDFLPPETVDFLIDWLFLMMASFGSGIKALFEVKEIVAIRKVILHLYINEKFQISTKLEHLADHLKVFRVLLSMTPEESRTFFTKFKSSSKLRKGMDSCYLIWKRIPPMYVCEMFLLETDKPPKKEGRPCQIDLYERAGHVKTFLFPNNKNLFDSRLPRLTDKGFLKSEWEDILRLFAKDVCNDNISFLPSSAEICSIVIDELKRSAAESLTQPNLIVNNFYSSNLSKLHYERKEREHLRVLSLLSLVEMLDNSILTNIYEHDLQKLHQHKLRIRSELGLDTNAIFTLFNFAYKCGNFELIVLFTTYYFSQQDYSNRVLDTELLTFICWFVRSCVELKDAESINGIKCWIYNNFNAEFTWINSAEMLAGGKFETALISLDVISCEHVNSRDVVTETIFMLREKALRVLCEPSLCQQCSPAFYSQFIRPIGSPPMYHTELLNPDILMELTVWTQFDQFRSPVAPPNLDAVSHFNRFDALNQVESNLSSLHKLFTNFGVQSVPDILTCICESERLLLNFMKGMPSFGLTSTFATQILPLQVVVHMFRDIIFSTNTIDDKILTDMLWRGHKWPPFVRIDMGQRISMWVEKIFGCNQTRFPELNTLMIKLNRKMGNVMTANCYLNKMPRGGLNQFVLRNNFSELNNLSEALKLEILRSNPSNNVGLMQVLALADLTASYLDIQLAANSAPPVQTPQPVVKACLKLANVVQRVPVNSELILNKISKSNSKFWSQINESLNKYRAICQGASFGRLFRGSLLTMATSLSTEVPKTSLHLAEWALEQVSTDSGLGVDAIRLLPSEEVALQALCGLSDTKRDSFLLAIGKVDSLEEFQAHIQKSSEFMNDANLLKTIQSTSFEQLWEVLKKRQHMFYDIAVQYFAKFLEHTTDVEWADQMSAALQLINLLTSHPNFFAQLEAVADWTKRTNVLAWVKLVQQVFAQLNHADPFVRNTLKLLICQIGNSHPHAVCYAALVRVNNSETLLNKNADENLIDNSSSQDSPVSTICSEILENLSQNWPKLIQDLQLFVAEFDRIVLLASEKWLFVLNHLEQDVLRSCRQVERERVQLLEVIQSEEQADLFVSEAKKIIFNNALKVVEDLYRTTCVESFETTERHRFVRNFKELIRRSIRKAGQYFERPNASFDVFRKLISRLSASISLQTQYNIKLANLSLELATTTNWSIPLPGQETLPLNDDIVTIQQVDPYVRILPTKTRPKKITFIGSNGKRYTFLCKGQEDLRIDQQISNLFWVCTQLFKTHKLTKHNPNLPYSIRYYNVTPLGPKSGLIQWVNETVSLYSIYRSWKTVKLNQQRTRRVAAEKSQSLEDVLLTKSPERKFSEPDALDIELLSEQERVDPISDQNFMAQQLSQGSACLEILSKPETPKQRRRLLRHVPDQTLQLLKMSPIEMFASVLRTKFREKNIKLKAINSRKNWPIDVLLDVFDELSTMVPSTLIADEFRMESLNSSDWWQKVRRFARSMAISSIVGALLELGDRHLDNLLVDFSTGEIVHVDYNVSFGRGKTLRVPEVVPFRLTKNIVNALGPTKVEGIFRLSAKNTLEVLRSRRVVITSMLSSFVYDPLPEWMSVSKQFNMGALNFGISLIVYGNDQRLQFAAKTAFSFINLYLKLLLPKFKEIREELETALMATCQLFTEMNTYRLNVGSELQHFNDRRVSTGIRLKNAIISHQNVMRSLKPVFRILTRVDLRFSNFMKTYRSTFSGPLVSGHKLLNEPTIDYISCIKNFQTALVNLESVYTQLAELRNIEELLMCTGSPMLAVSCEDVSLAGSLYQELLPSINEKQVNEVGVDIVNKCQMFLKGIDDLEQSPMSVEEHVKKLIQEATDKQALCRMFEGWCPWI